MNTHRVDSSLNKLLCIGLKLVKIHKRENQIKSHSDLDVEKHFFQD